MASAVTVCVLLLFGVGQLGAATQGGGTVAADVSRTPATTTPLPRAHAHNDYQHQRPLQDALERGFCSVEADVFAIQDTLLVGHTVFDLRKGRTLDSLYLEPLRRRVAANGGRVYRGGPAFTLLIDIKVDGKRAYPVLAKKLAKYRQMLARFEDGKFHEGAVQVVVSGDRPREMIVAEKRRYAAIDGRLSDLASDAPSHLIPLISDRWTSHFSWRGEGPFPEKQRAKLREIVSKAHAKGRRVRFWATPESVAVWQELLAADVDHINTDRLDQLRRFLQKSDGGAR